MPVFLSLRFPNGKRSREVPIGSPFDELFFSASMALPPFFKEIRNGREKLLIGGSNSVAPPPVVADLIEPYYSGFSLHFHGFHEGRVGAGVFADSLFSLDHRLA